MTFLVGNILWMPAVIMQVCHVQLADLHSCQAGAVIAAEAAGLAAVLAPVPSGSGLAHQL